MKGWQAEAEALQAAEKSYLPEHVNREYVSDTIAKAQLSFFANKTNEMVNQILDAMAEGDRIRRENNKAKQIGQVGTPENTFGAY